MKIVTADQSSLFFKALLANGLFSTSSGLTMLLFSKPIAARIGFDQPQLILGIGVMLLLFGGSLLFHALRKRIRRVEALAISAMDLGWVLGSALLVLLAPQLLNPTGITVVIALAVVVFSLFELQAFALWKVRGS